MTTDAGPDIFDRTHDAFQVAEPILPSRFDRNIDQVVDNQEAPCYAVRSEQRARLTSAKPKATPISSPIADDLSNHDTQSPDQCVPVDSNTVDPIVHKSTQANYSNRKASYTIEMNTILTTPGTADTRSVGQSTDTSRQPV